MSLETNLYTTLQALVSGELYPSVNPEAEKTLPYAVYQQTGGQPLVYFEHALADLQNARMQITVWHKTQLEAADLMRQIETAMVAATVFQAEPVTKAIWRYDEQTGYYGAMQIFDIWHT